MRKILVLTGTRAEYGILKPVIEKIILSTYLELQLVVTGMHLSDLYGKTIDVILSDGIPISASYEMLPEDDSSKAMARSLAVGIDKAVDVISDLDPDIVLVLGDRIEVLAMVLSAAYMNKFIAHIHGGDTSKGGIDESARHAITKYAHIHFPATEKSKERILQMGEDPKYVFRTGSPSIDTIMSINMLSVEELSTKLGFSIEKEYFLILQHPVSTQSDQALEQIQITIDAIRRFPQQKIVIGPNSDAGGRRILNFLEAQDDILLIKNVEHISFLSLLKCCQVMIGNSSSGIIETPLFKIPVVNIGIRQEGREYTSNVIHVSHRVDEIASAIDKALTDNEFRGKLQHAINPYGDGSAAVQIVEHLASIQLNDKIRYKHFIS